MSILYIIEQEKTLRAHLGQPAAQVVGFVLDAHHGIGTHLFGLGQQFRKGLLSGLFAQVDEHGAFAANASGAEQSRDHDADVEGPHGDAAHHAQVLHRFVPGNVKRGRRHHRLDQLLRRVVAQHVAHWSCCYVGDDDYKIALCALFPKKVTVKVARAAEFRCPLTMQYTLLHARSNGSFAKSMDDDCIILINFSGATFGFG